MTRLDGWMICKRTERIFISGGFIATTTDGGRRRDDDDDDADGGWFIILFFVTMAFFCGCGLTVRGVLSFCFANRATRRISASWACSSENREKVG